MGIGDADKGKANPDYSVVYFPCHCATIAGMMRTATLLKNGRPAHSQQGTAVIVILALLAILMIFLAGNFRVLNNLDRELKLIERQHLHRLSHTAPAKNHVAVTNSISASSP